jgi:hypothetical protein
MPQVTAERPRLRPNAWAGAVAASPALSLIAAIIAGPGSSVTGPVAAGY